MAADRGGAAAEPGTALEHLQLAGGRLVAALDTDAGGAVVRVVTADGERVHLWAPHAAGRLEAGRAGGGPDLGPLVVGEVVDGEVRLAGPFGWLSVPSVDRVDRLDRWRGPIGAPGTEDDEPKGEADPGRADAVQVLAQPEVEIRVTHTASDGATSEILLAAAGDDAVVVPSVDGVEGDGVLFASQDLTLRLAEVTGLLAHPTVPASPPPEPGDGAHLVTVVVTRVEADGAIAGGYLRWIDDGPTGWLNVVDRAEERSGELAVIASRRPVPSVVDELLGYVLGEPEDPTPADPPG